MDRRQFFKSAKETTNAMAAPQKSQRILTTDLTPYSGTWGNDQVRHLLRRTLFGFTKAEFDSFKAMTMGQAVDAILNIGSTQPNPPVNNYQNSVPDNTGVLFGNTWVNSTAGDGNVEFQRRYSVKAWWTGLILSQSPTIREKMNIFWHNHFATESDAVTDSRMIYKHHAMLRANCLGNFKDLVKKVTIDPAMLKYLNGALNTATAPDENYARELQELFCVGKGPNSQYTEDDVKAAAKVLTGWRVNATTTTSYFDPTRHSTADKQFSAFYANTKITGQTGANGANELDALLNMIFATNEVSMFICRKLYRFFIYYDISTDTETNIITPLAKVFRDNNYDIKPVLETLLKSSHFYDALNMACMIKNPIDALMGNCRQFETIFPDISKGADVQYNHWAYLESFAALIGMDLADPPNVAGWSAYWQQPQYYELWINSDTLPKRNQFTDIMLYAGYKRNGFTTVIDTVAFAKLFPNPEDPNKLITDVCEFLLPLTVSQTVKDGFKSILLYGQAQDYYWTNAWNAYKADPNDTINKNYVISQLKAFLKSVMNLAEYQLS